MKKIAFFLLSFLLIISCFIGFSSPARAATTGTISAQIVDAQGGEIVDSVWITLYAVKAGKETKYKEIIFFPGDASFKFSKLPFGSYKLAIWSMKYKILTTAVTKVNAKKPKVNLGILQLIRIASFYMNAEASEWEIPETGGNIQITADFLNNLDSLRDFKTWIAVQLTGMKNGDSVSSQYSTTGPDLAVEGRGSKRFSYTMAFNPDDLNGIYEISLCAGQGPKSPDCFCEPVEMISKGPVDELFEVLQKNNPGLLQKYRAKRNLAPVPAHPAQ